MASNTEWLERWPVNPLDPRNKLCHEFSYGLYDSALRHGLTDYEACALMHYLLCFDEKQEGIPTGTFAGADEELPRTGYQELVARGWAWTEDGRLYLLNRPEFREIFHDASKAGADARAAALGGM